MSHRARADVRRGSRAHASTSSTAGSGTRPPVGPAGPDRAESRMDHRVAAQWYERADSPRRRATGHVSLAHVRPLSPDTDAEPVGRRVDRVVRQVVADRAVDDTPCLTRIDGQQPKDGGQPERPRRRESIAQGAAHERDRPILGRERRQVTQPGPGPVHDQVTDIRPPIAIDLRPVEQVPVDGPSRVAVEGMTRTIGVPAVTRVPGKHPVDALVDEPVLDHFAQTPADGRHDGREEHPVVGIDVAPVDLGQPREHLPQPVRPQGRDDAVDVLSTA